MEDRFHRNLASIRLLLALVLLALQPVCYAQAGIAGESNVLFILDGSGSMWAQIYGKTKIAIAKDVMINLIRQLPNTVNTGLEVYGHRRKGDCNDIEVLSPVGESDKTTLIRQIQSIQPKGKTPITGSLKLAAEQLKTAEEETTVVLISDGKETCQGDPCSLVRQLREQGTKVKVHVVGFDVNQVERKQLACIAEAGGGRYFTAQNASELTNALIEVRKEVIAVAEAKAKESETTTKQKVVRISRPAIGTIEIRNNKDFVAVLDQKTGEKKGDLYFAARTVHVPAGTYKLQFPNFVVEGVEVGPGEKKIIDANTLVGWISIPNMQGFADVLDQKTSEKKGDLYFAGRNRTVQVPAGTYKLKFPNFVVEGIEVGPGEKKIIDINTLVGWISIPNMKGFADVLDQKTGEKKGDLYFAAKTVQVPPGTYQLKFPNFTMDGIVVEAGQTVVVELE